MIKRLKLEGTNLRMRKDRLVRGKYLTWVLIFVIG